MLLSGVLALAAGAAETPKFIWIEGETPSRANFEHMPDGGPLLSGGLRLQHSLNKNEAGELPSEGLAVAYDFEAKEAGKYELWIRLGFEFVRPPLEWRVDDGAWGEISPDVLTTSLMEISMWNEIGWAKAGLVNLTAGEHAIQLRFARPGSDGRLLIGVDCLAFIKGTGNFVPEGSLKPGQTYDAEIDRRAEAQVYNPYGDAWEVKQGHPQIDLTGLWQVARWDDPDMDKDSFKPVEHIPSEAECPLRWMGVALPGDLHENKDRPEMRFGHRYFLRTRVKIPSAYQGKGIHLHFTESAWILSVFVNGTYVGGHTTVLVPWDIDLTPHLKPGKMNEIVLGVKSSWYAMDPSFGRTKKPSLDHCRNMPTNLGNARYWGMLDAVYCSAGMPNGLRGPVRLIATGHAYTSDIFIRTSLTEKRIEADVEVSNVTDAAVAAEVTCEAINDRTGDVENTLGPSKVTVPSRGSAKVAMAGAWDNPQLWWPEPNADVYTMRTTIRVDGKVVDTQEELFGFREVAIEGRHFLLNGIRFHGLCWQGLGGKISGPQEWVERYRSRNHTYIRTHGTRGIGKNEDNMHVYDREGIAQFCPTWINGMFLNYECPNPVMWQNMERHVRQYIKAYRNHPSILNWSLGNEFMLVNARLGYWNEYELWEEKAAKLVQAQIELDPTRRSYFDGGGDLGGRIEIDCNHYGWRYGAGFPACAYTYPIGPAAYPRPRDRDELYLWTGDKPLIFGEVFHYQLGTPDMSWIGGPSAYRGVSYQDVAATRYMAISVEGARWQDATGICLFGEVDGSLKDSFVSYEPQAVFVREHNSGFYSGADYTRRIGVFNDTRSKEPITLKWSIIVQGKAIDSREKVYTIEPGHHEDDTITCRLPDVAVRTRGDLNLQLLVKGKRVFADTKPVVVTPAPQGPTDLAAGSLYVFDPAAKVVPWITERGLAHQVVATIVEIPSTAKIALVGPQAFDRKNVKEAAATLRQVVLAGGTAIVMEQETPLQKDDLPLAGIQVPSSQGKEPTGMAEFATEARGRSGSIAHPVAVAHAVLNDVLADDLFTWGGDEFNFRRSYSTPSGGPICIIQAGDKLGLTPLMEVPVGQGSYLLSQMLIGEKLGLDPTADLLLHNALVWANDRAGREPGRTLVVDPNEALTGMLDSTGLLYETTPTPDAAVFDSSAQVVVARATPGTSQWLGDNADAVRTFCRNGGWLVVTDLDKKGLPHFNRLVGFEHRIRPFGSQACKVVEHGDPLLLGLSDRDFSQFSDKMIAPWVKKYGVSDNVFTHVVDGEDIGGFVTCRYLKLFNGLTNVDFWHYVQYFQFEGDAEGTIASGQGEKEEAEGRKGIGIDITFDRPETIRGLNIQMSQIYYTAKDIKIIFDDGENSALAFELANNSDKQEVAFPQPRTTSKISIVILSHHGGISSRDVKIVTLDTLEVLRQMPDGGPVALTNPGGLVKYPIGKGGILLNQLDYTSSPPPDTPEKAQNNYLLNVPKKQAIYANLLRNMGASFKVL